MADPTKWTPTENQEAALKRAEACEWKFKIVNLCADIGVDRSSYYQWFKTPGFVAWWNEAVERWFALRMPAMYGDILESVRMESSRRNMSAAKLLMERFDKGYAPRSRQDVKADVAVRKAYVNLDIPAVIGAGTTTVPADGEGVDDGEA